MKVHSLILLLLFPFLIKAQSQEEIDKYFEELKNRPVALKNRTIPPFNVYSIDNEFYSEDSLKGRITLINLWFEACVPCIAEMGALNDLYAKYRSNTDFRFLAFTYEKPANIERIKNKYDIEYPLISISHDSCYILNFNGGFPTTMISDKNGKVAYYTLGGFTDPDKSRAYFINEVYPELDKLLNKEE